MSITWHLVNIFLCFTTSFLWTPIYILIALEAGKRARDHERDVKLANMIRHGVTTKGNRN